MSEDSQPGATTSSANTSLTLPDGVTLDILPIDDVQNAALYRLSWGEVRFLLAGGLRNRIKTPDSPADVMLVSPLIRADLRADLLQKVNPTIVIIQSDNNEPDESSRTLAPTLAVYITNDVGQITLTTDGQRLWVETER